MKDLLLAIKEHLKNDSTLDYVPDNSIYIACDENLIPSYAKMPAIAIKDGNIRNTQQLTKNYNQTAWVRVTCYQQILKEEESMIGTYGVLQMCADVFTSLIDEKLDIAGVMNVFPTDEEASQTIGDEREMIQKKTIVLQYVIHKTWT